VLDLGLSSETVSGLSEPGHAGGAFPRPDLHERLDRVLAQTKPNLVFACYGMNCGIYHPLSDERFAAYKKGISTLREKVLATGARIVFLTPPVFDALPIAKRLLPAGLEAYPQPYQGYDDVLAAYGDWLVGQRLSGWTVLDLHTAMKAALGEQRKTKTDYTYAADGVHPNEAGHRIFAGLINDYLGLTTVVENHIVLEKIESKQRLLKDAWLSATGHKRPGVKPGLPLPQAQEQAASLDAAARVEARQMAAAHPLTFPGKQSVWQGHDRYDLPVNGHLLTVVLPKSPAPGNPWCWEGEFFGHKVDPDVALLAKGFAIVYLNAPNLLGSPQAVAKWEAAYDYLVHLQGFHARPALTGLSRGGLYALNFAIAHPDHVSCIYLDAAVCDFKSWSGGKGKGKGSAEEWKRVLTVYGLADEAAALSYKGNPVDNLTGLAQAKVPLLNVYGDADDTVPWQENTGILQERYPAAGGSITLIPKPGINHHHTHCRVHFATC
jgi:lysophospholipase L1-like esterase/pimeloyl-ACP methyl ester carboxylesterase